MRETLQRVRERIGEGRLLLTGEKVTLRAITRADMETFFRYDQDVELAILGGGDPPGPSTIEGQQRWYDDHIAKETRDSVHFAIETEGKLIGFCFLWHFNRVAQTCELGISIGERDYWGRGYGRDAIHLLLDYAFRLHNFRKVWLTTSSTNERAVRCYRSCGFVEEGRKRAHLWSDGQYVDEVHMGILRDEWQQKGF